MECLTIVSKLLTRSKSLSLQIKPIQNEAPQYDIKNEAAVKKLEAAQKGKFKFKYDLETNKLNKNLKLFIAPNSLMGGRLGVYANQDIKKTAKPIGMYAGKRNKRGGDINSLYTFQITDKNEKIVEYIVADHLRDWTGFINHSPIPNLFVDQKKIKNKTHLCIFLDRDIKKGEQLVYNYGDFYFNDPSFRPFYIHSTDDWRTPQELYLQLKKYYTKDRYILDETMCDVLQLHCTKTTDFVLPSIFTYIHKNQIKELKKAITQSYPVDLLAYACEKNNIKPNHQQQHLTALMFACYMGNEEAIQLLIDLGADCDRRMLLTGYSPLTVLTLGLGSPATIERMGKILLKKMKHAEVSDQYALGLLHYAVKRNIPSLVKHILKYYDKDSYDWLDDVYEQKHTHSYAELDYCLKQGQFEVLKIMMLDGIETYQINSGLVETINKRRCFTRGFLLTVSLENLLQFQALLQQKPFKPLQKKTKLISRLISVIRNKQMALL